MTTNQNDQVISGARGSSLELATLQREEDYYRALSRISRFRNKEAIVRELLVHIADSDRNQLAAEKRKADLLLNNILPAYMVEELKTHGRVAPAHHENAFILMTDFVGFSSISRYMSPGELLRELTIYFDAFEEISEKYGMEKVKTIGDALLCVGGLRDTARTVHLDFLLAAMEMMQFTHNRQQLKKSQGEDAWGMRAVIHCGPLVAGVVGHSKIAFDIWGHTVNVASRIESVAAAGTITISEEVYQKVRDFFDCDFSGEFELKGTGRRDLFTVRGLRKLFRGRTERKFYNERFEYLYDSLAMGHRVMRKDGRYYITKKRGLALPPRPVQKKQIPV